MNFLGLMLKRLSNMTVPEFALAQPPRIANILPYAGFRDVNGLPIIHLKDGSIGVAWELGAVEHELLTNEKITMQVQAIARLIDSITHPRVIYQFIWSSLPSTNFPVPEHVANPKTYAQKILAERVKFKKSIAENRTNKLACMRRTLYLTCKIQSVFKTETKGFFLGNTTTALKLEADQLKNDLAELKEIVARIENGLDCAGIAYRRSSQEQFMGLIRSFLHSSSFLNQENWTDYTPNEPIDSQYALDFVKMARWGIQLGDHQPETVQVLSWGQKPNRRFDGMMAHLLNFYDFPEPMQVVFNIRPCHNITDIKWKALVLEKAVDALGRIQLGEIQRFQTRQAQNEKTYWASLHCFLRNNCGLEGINDNNKGRAIAHELSEKTGIPFVVENYAAPAIFGINLPLGYCTSAGTFTKRERRLQSADIGSFLPIFGGFKGTRTQNQLMISRSGDPIYLSARDSEENPHIALLASSRAGKSFYMANYIASERALYPNSLDYIIDNKTSYEILAKVFGEEGGYVLAKPPETFPNIFLGRADNDRLNLVTAILRSAITLASPDAKLSSEHTDILKRALLKTFGANYIDANTRFQDGNLVRRAQTGSVVVPRLTDVVNKLTEVCQELDINLQYAEWIRTKLSPFFGQGQYAAMFDQHYLADAEPRTPCITLVDLKDVSDDPILKNLTAQICIVDFLRHVKKPENIGRPGRLIIEEAGILGDKSQELASFAREAWKTFGKLNICCIGLTNEVDDYREKPAPKTMWNISSTKIVLRMIADDLARARSSNEAAGIPKLFPDNHIAEIAASLKKKDGIYSQGLWWGSTTKGTFIYAPTGYDYWLAASKPKEVSIVDRAAKHLGSYWDALQWLAKNNPAGFRDQYNQIRDITDSELADILNNPNQEAA